MTAVCLRMYRLFLLALWFVPMLFYGMYLHTRYRTPTKNFAFGAKVWGGGIAKIINLKVIVHGDISHINGLLVSNHVSYIDILALASIFPLRFAPKSDLASWPLIGWFLSMSRPIWVNRSSRQGSKKTLDDFLHSLKTGVTVAVFPEGTSTDGKSPLRPFKSTPFESVIIGGFPVNPVLLKYEDIGEETICWYGDMSFLPHVWYILGKAEIKVHLYTLPPISSNGLDRKALAAKTHEIMNTEFQKLVPL